MITLDISIDGMHCEHCVRSIQDALEVLPGVSNCRVQIGKAEVIVDEVITGKRDLFAAIRDAGAFQVLGFGAVDQHT